MLLRRAPHVESAQINQTTVLFDERRDQYLVLEPAAALAWQALVAPTSPAGVVAQVAPVLPLPEDDALAAAEDALRELAELGVLDRAPSRGALHPRYARVMSAAAFAATFAAVLATLGSGAALAQSYGGSVE